MKWSLSKNRSTIHRRLLCRSSAYPRASASRDPNDAGQSASLQGWVQDGTFLDVVRALAKHLKERGGFDLTEGLVDASFSGAKKKGLLVGKTKRGKGTKVVAAVDGQGLPVAFGIASASPHEVKVIEATLDDSLLDELPERLIGDKAYDSDRLDERLWDERGVKNSLPRAGGAANGRPLKTTGNCGDTSDAGR